MDKKYIKMEVFDRSSGIIRKVVLESGKLYKVDPINPQKMKHRGRICEFIRWYDDDSRGERDIIEVRFLDTNRKGRVEGSDLVEYEGD
jgi:hypothetical protein